MTLIVHKILCDMVSESFHTYIYLHFLIDQVPLLRFLNGEKKHTRMRCLKSNYCFMNGSPKFENFVITFVKVHVILPSPRLPSPGFLVCAFEPPHLTSLSVMMWMFRTEWWLSSLVCVFQQQQQKKAMQFF